MTRDELEMHAYTARKLLNNPEWTPTRLLWARLVSHLDSALALNPALPEARDPVSEVEKTK